MAGEIAGEVLVLLGVIATLLHGLNVLSCQHLINLKCDFLREKYIIKSLLRQKWKIKLI